MNNSKPLEPTIKISNWTQHHHQYNIIHNIVHNITTPTSTKRHIQERTIRNNTRDIANYHRTAEMVEHLGRTKDKSNQEQLPERVNKIDKYSTTTMLISESSPSKRSKIHQITIIQQGRDRRVKQQYLKLLEI